MTMFELRDMDDYDRELLRQLPKGMQVGCGCLTAKQHGVETPEEVAAHVRKVLEVVEPERVVLHPDCGFSPGTYWNISIDDVYDKAALGGAGRRHAPRGGWRIGAGPVSGGSTGPWGCPRREPSAGRRRLRAGSSSAGR